MVTGRKRQRSKQRKQDDTRAECPFTISYPGRENKKPRKRKRQESEEENRKVLTQLSPFTPTGKFGTHGNMDIAYVVEPHKMWHEMTRYNSFVLNGHKYHSEGFIFVANDSTIERQRNGNKNGTNAVQNRTDDEWVARILEIRASDEHHVYARVYWMYWPDDIPHGTLDGKKFISGRQSYHGQTELIASNHMDVINVVSVTAQAFVNQWLEENDDEVQDALYWRQGFDFRTMELSAVELVCSCHQPANPDKTLIGCTDSQCHKWLHMDCILHDALTTTYREYGRDRPYTIASPPPKESSPAHKDLLQEEQDGATRPLSPGEADEAHEVKQTIDIRSDSADDDVLAKKTSDYDVVASAALNLGAAAEPSTMTPKESTPSQLNTALSISDELHPADINPAVLNSAELNPTQIDPAELINKERNSTEADSAEIDPPDTSPSQSKPTEPTASTTTTTTTLPIMPKPTELHPKPVKNGRGRPRKRGNDDLTRGVKGPKPYLGFFTASLNTETSPPVIEITDLRKTVGGEKSWTIAISCLVCGKPVE